MRRCAGSLGALCRPLGLAPFLGPFLVGKTLVADVINYIAGLIFGMIKPMPR
jgi:hypothetical protein